MEGNQRTRHFRPHPPVVRPLLPPNCLKPTGRHFGDEAQDVRTAERSKCRPRRASCLRKSAFDRATRAVQHDQASDVTGLIQRIEMT